MVRRHFIKSTLALGGAAMGSGNPEVSRRGFLSKHKFKLKYAPHFGMFSNSAGPDLIDQLKFMADQGFTALEDNGMMGRAVDLQEKIGKEMERLRMEMGVFVIKGGGDGNTLASGKKENTDFFIDRCKKSVEVAKRVNAKWMTVVPGDFDWNLPIGIQTGNVIDALRRGAELLEPHGLVMVLEPLSDSPYLFLRTSEQAYEICRAVNSSSCKILYDIYHMQKNEGRLIYNIDLTWNEIAYFQIGDEPGRNEPTTGEINYKNVFKYIHDRGRKEGRSFILGMEHGNLKPGKEGEEALIRAYLESDSFSV